MKRWLARFIAQRKQRKSTRACQGKLEALESRWLLAALRDEADVPVPAWFAATATSIINPLPLAPSKTIEPPFVGPRNVQLEWVARLSDELIAQIGTLEDVSRLLSTRSVQVQVKRGLGLVGLVQLTTLSDDATAAEDFFANNPYIVDHDRNWEFVGNLLPNDADFGNQSALESSGQFGSLVDADVDATQAWNTSTGSTQVVVGVIDSGIDLSHADLYLNVWINQGEIGSSKRNQLQDIDSDGLITFYDLNDARNASLVRDLNRNGYIDARDLLADASWTDGVDTDRNGFVDDFFGWNFRDEVDEPFEPNDPSDASGHGTYVSGIIGAVGNNSVGIAGLNWRSSLMALKFLDQKNQGDVASAIAAVNYATMMRNEFATNVRVLNNSWGQAGSFSSALNDALTAAQNADILIVAAAGNGNVLGVGVDNDRTPFYPASYPLDNLLSVAASDGQDRLAAFSNYGLTSVDLVAPGVGIRSTLPGGRYGEANGTSMATPFVAGTAALIWSALPQASASEVRQALLSSVDPFVGLQSTSRTAGRLNAGSAIASKIFAPTATLVRADDVAVAGGSVHEIVVRFSDRNGLDLSSLGDEDLQIEHQWGSHETLGVLFQPSSLTANSSGTEAIATYRLTPPGGSWDAFDFGNYRVQLLANTVRSLDGKTSNRAQTLGQFRVQVSAANVIYVDTFDDDERATSLRAAIESANRNRDQSFTIFLDTGDYRLDRPFVADPGFGFDVSSVPVTCSSGTSVWSNSLSGDLEVLGRVTILGDSANQTSITGQTGDRLFKLHAGASLTLKGMSLRGGTTRTGQSGGAILSMGDLRLEQVELRGNSATGGLTPARGGAIAAWAGSVALVHSRVTENLADFGGGVFACGSAQLNVQRSTIDNNHGGGIVSYATVDGIIDNSTIANNFEGAIAANARDFPGGNGSSSRANISVDGRFVSFLSDATNLLPGDSNAARDAYLLDRSTQHLQMLSVSNAGQAARNHVDGLVLSGNGQQAVFLTQSNNLTSGDNLLTNDVFVRNVIDSNTALVSSGPTGRAARGIPALSDDGRYVAFQQTVAGDPFNTWAVYVSDRQLGTTERLSLNTGSAVANISFLDQTTISGDGRYVVLSAQASGTADAFFHEIYVIDRVNQTTKSLPVRAATTAPTGSLYHAAISGDGRFVTFTSDDSRLVANDSNGLPDVFLYDTVARSLQRISQASAGAPANGASQLPSISRDGRFLAFESQASNLVANDQNGLSDVFVIDRVSMAIERVSVSAAGLDTNGSSGAPALSGDGRFVVFESTATNIVPVHSNHERAPADNWRQVFLRDRLAGRNESISAFELPSTLRVNSSTLVFNSGAYTIAGNVTVQNSLMAGNLVGFDVGARSASAGSNLYASASPGARLISSDRQNSDTALKLGPLTDFENLPPGYPLLQGNPAIDAGASQAVGTLDQWNQLRVVPDIGAVETVQAAIGGRLFADLNGNQQQDADEPGLSDQVLFIDDNNDGVQQTSEKSLTTILDNGSGSSNQTGQFQFTNLTPGKVDVRAVVPNQWRATPLPNVRVTAGSVQGNGASTSPVFSSSGSTVAFLSSSTNFTSNDDSNPSIFVYTRATGSIEKLPVDGPNLQVVGIAGPQDRTILLRNDSGVYQWDRQQQSLRTISQSNSGQLGNAHSDQASMSDDGRWVALSSFASNLVPGDSDAFADIFLVDTTRGSIVSVTQLAVGKLGNNDSESPSLSSDGQTLAFVSDANNLVTDDTNGLGDIFVFSASTQSIRRINLSASGAQSNGFTYPPQVSGDGRFVVFQSLATNLVSGDVNSASDLFVVDLQNNSIERLDIPWLVTSQLENVNPAINYDGQYITFEATSSQLAHPSANSQRNVFVYDRSSDGSQSRLQLVSRDAKESAASGDSRYAQLSQDGRLVVYQSLAINLVAADTNAQSDIFVGTNPFEDASQTVNLQAGQAVTDLDFALQPRAGTITGTLFDDLSGDGAYDLGDPTLSAWTVFLDGNANGRRDVGESFAISQSDGSYQFADVPAYREHVLSVELPTNWEQTVPERLPGQPRLFLPAGGSITGRNFGFRVKTTLGQSENARIEGRIYNDTNGSGAREPSEPVLAGTEVYLDLNSNERRDFGEPRTVSDAQGNYSFTGLGSRNYSVRIATTEGTNLTSPLGNRFTAMEQVLVSGAVSLSKPQDIAIADLDGRNGPDLAIALYSGNSVVLQLNSGSGAFSSSPITLSLAPAGLGPIAIASAQINRRGHDDLVIANSLNNTLTVLLDFDGTAFSTQRTISVGAVPLDVLIGDVDADGDNDLVAATQGTSFAGQLRLFLNDGTGQFTAGGILGSGGKRAVAIATADLNRDNVLDLVVANQGDFGRNGDSGNVAVLLGRGNGSYAAAVPYNVGSTPLDVSIADLNGDSLPDLATVNFALNTASLLRGTGSGAFQVVSEQISVGQGPVTIELLDIEGDNDVDLLVTNLTSRTISFVRNRQQQSRSGNMDFQPAESFGVAEIPIGARLGFAAADLDASGTIDLALINSETNSLKVLSNSLVAGSHRVQLTGNGTTAGLDFGVRFETLLPKLDPISSPTSILEDFEPFTIALTGISRGRSSGPPLKITATSSAPSVLGDPSIQYIDGATSGQLFLAPIKDAVGQAIITVEIRDAGADQQFETNDDGVVTRSFSITVTPVNDAPIFGLLGNQVISIGSNLRTVPGFANDFTSGGGTDERSQFVADYLINVDRPNLFLVQPAIDVQGTVRYQPNLSTTGLATVRVQVKDNGGTEFGGIDRSVPLTFQISVIDLADGDIDFGDAAEVYPVSLRANGARHKLSSVYLGAAVDNEPDGRPGADALGDDAQLDDEDGIQWLVPPMASRTQPTQSSLRAVASMAGKIDAWIDFNQDGDWNDTGEQILTSAVVVAGANWLPFTVPAASLAGSTYARVRLSSNGGLSIFGLADDGEVEDYRIVLLDAQASPASSITVEIGNLPAHKISLLDGQFVLQSASQILVSLPASSLAAFRVITSTGSLLYAIADPNRNLVGTLEWKNSAAGAALHLSQSVVDLSSLQSAAFEGIQRAELVANEAQQLSITPDDLKKLNSIGSLELVLGAGDTVNTSARWRLTSRQQEDTQLVSAFAFQNQALLTRAAAGWYNPLRAYDVNGDGFVTPLDALLIINYINQNAGSLNLPPFDSQRPLEHGFYDVSSSNTIEPLDVLLVINVLNTRSEGERS